MHIHTAINNYIYNLHAKWIFLAFVWRNSRVIVESETSKKIPLYSSDPTFRVRSRRRSLPFSVGGSSRISVHTRVRTYISVHLTTAVILACKPVDSEHFEIPLFGSENFQKHPIRPGVDPGRRRGSAPSLWNVAN